MVIDSTLLIGLIPLVVIELVLKVVCFADWRRREQFRLLPRMAWLPVFLFVTLFGPIAYLVVGRKTDGEGY